MDGAVSTMERNMRDINALAESIEDILMAVETERNVDSFQKALSAVSNALKTNQKDEEFVNIVISFYDRLLEMKECRFLIESSSIHSHILNLLTITKGKSKPSYNALIIVLKAMEYPKVCPYFSSPQFISLLVYILRINPKSSKHVKLISAISKKMNNRNGDEYKELCNAFITISRSIPLSDKRQMNIVTALSHLMNSKIIGMIGNAAIPLCTKICMEQQNSFTLAKCLFNIASKSTNEKLDKDIITVVERQERDIRSDKEALQSVIFLLSSKNNAKDTPPFAVSLAYEALQIFINDKNIVEQALTVCFRGLAASDESITVSPSLATVVTTIMSTYMRDKGIIRRCAAILHSLSADPENDVYLSFSAAPLIIVETMNANMDDQHSISICSNALFNIILDNELLAQQIDSTANLNTLKAIAKKHKNKANIVKNVVETLFTVMKTEYEPREFIDLPDDLKAKYQIDYKIVNSLPNELIDDQDFVRCCLVLIAHSPKNSSIVAKAMLKYSQDPEIVFAAFAQGIDDIGAINKGLMTINEEGIRFVYQTLMNAKEPLPVQIISLLLSYDRQDSIDILKEQIKNGADSIIASQMQLSFVSQIPIAKELYQRKLWTPSENDAEIVIRSLAFSKFDEERLADSLCLLQNIGLSSESYPLLIDFIYQYPNNEQIVSICCTFIKRFPDDPNFIDLTCQFNVIQKVTASIDEKKNEKTNFAILNLLSTISAFPVLQSKFNEPVIIKIADVANISERCSSEVSRTFSNLSKSQAFIDILPKLDVLNTAFKNFSSNSYQLVHSIIESNSQSLTDNQIKTIVNEFNTNIMTSSLSDAISLSKLVLDLVQSEKVSENDISNSVICHLFSMYIADHEMVQCLASLVSYINNFYVNEEMVFSIITAMKVNIKDFNTVFKLANVLSKVPCDANKPKKLDSPSIINVIMEIIDYYYNDSSICTPLFPLLEKHGEAFHVAMKAFLPNKEKEDLVVIIHYLLHIGLQDYDEYISNIFEVMKVHSYSFEVVTSLSPLVYFASDSEATHEIILDNLQLLLDSSVRFLNSNRISRALPAILFKLSINPSLIPLLKDVPPYIEMIIKAWPEDPQIAQAVTGLIANFTNAGKAYLFTGVLPMITTGLRQECMTDYMCEIITSLSKYIGCYGNVIAAKLFDIMANSNQQVESDTEEEEYNERSVLATTLYSLSRNSYIDDVIYENLEQAFTIINNTDESDDIRISILGFCTNIHTAKKIDNFKPYIENLLEILDGKKIAVSIAAGQCLLQLATLKTTLIDQHINKIMKVAKMSSGEQLRVCLAIKDKVYGLNI